MDDVEDSSYVSGRSTNHTAFPQLRRLNLTSARIRAADVIQIIQKNKFPMIESLSMNEVSDMRLASREGRLVADCVVLHHHLPLKTLGRVIFFGS